jgi:two-component system cell cycle response regulator
MYTDFIRILTVTADAALQTAVGSALKNPAKGVRFETHEADTADVGLGLIEQTALDCVLIDFALPDRNGLQVIEHIVERNRSDLTLILIGGDDKDTGARALEMGADYVLTKDEMRETLFTSAVCHAVERHRLLRELEESEDRIRALAIFDDLTRVFTRRHLMARLPQITSASIRHKYPVSICQCDLNDLKSINDRYGTAVGDRVLVHFTEVVQGTIRKEDIIGRVGDDEFCIVMTHCTQEQGVGIVQRIRDKFDNHEFYAGTNECFQAGISCGLAEYLPWESVEQWLRRTDQAMRAAKADALGIALATSPSSPPSDR